MCRLISLLLALTLLAGCDSGGDPEGRIPQRLVLTLNNEGTGRNPGTVLFVRTEEGYPCAGYRLPLDVARGGALLRLQVGAVLPPEGDACATVNAPAAGQARLEAGDGTYTLRVESFGRTDTYRLVIQNQRTTLEAVSASYTRVEAYPEG